MCGNRTHFKCPVEYGCCGPQAVADAGVTLEQISSVELVGGSSRVPLVITKLVEVFKNEPSRTLNAKECVSRGAALQCAMLSPIFR